MGLDLHHFKLVVTPKDLTDVIYATDLPDDLPAQYTFSAYIQDVPDMDIIHTVLFLPDRETYNWALARREADGYSVEKVSYLLGTPTLCADELAAIELRLGLTRNQAWFSTKRCIENGRVYDNAFAIYSRPTHRKGAYYVEVGYQRKGMVSRFYDDYTCEYYANRKRFFALPDYLGEEEKEGLLPNLRKSFLESYEPGRSVLFVSV